MVRHEQGISRVVHEMIDALLPSTDAGVALQFAGVLVVGFASLIVVRRNRDVRILVIGATVLLIALMALRAVH